MSKFSIAVSFKKMLWRIILCDSLINIYTFKMFFSSLSYGFCGTEVYNKMCVFEIAKKGK